MSRFLKSFLVVGFLLSAIPGPAAGAHTLSIEEIRATLSAPHRSKKNRVRDRYRHPAETLAFFGIAEDMKVVEVSPGTGWYTAVIAPLLLKGGKLYAAGNALEQIGRKDRPFGAESREGSAIA